MKPKLRLPDKKSKITLREVALNANVSESTVSRIMRNEGPVAEETRDKVMQSVRALGYVPNRIAGSLASLNTNLVGIVVPSLSNIVFPEVLNGINEGLSGRPHLQSVISVSEYNPELEEHIVRSLLSWKPTAILVTGFQHTDATRRMLQECTCRVVEMMETDGEPIDAAVGTSHFRTGYETVRHLIAKGYRRFGYISHDIRSDLRANKRFNGMSKALADNGLSFVADLRADQRSSVGTGKEMTARLRAQHPEVDVVVYSNDDMAVGGVFHCMGAGVSMPGDLAIFGFNGLEIGRHLPQPLSTILSNRFEIGRAAIEQVLSSAVRPEAPVIIDTGFNIIEGATA